jgi:hypothetical protein
LISRIFVVTIAIIYSFVGGQLWGHDFDCEEE